MIQYYMTEIGSQLDEGFGITADSFYNAAEVLKSSEEYTESFNPMKQMPVLYLYRHSSELYVKSLILILHRELMINFWANNKQSPDCRNPRIYNNKKNEWVELYKCHDIRVLIDYLINFVKKNVGELKERVPKVSWDFKGLNYESLLTIDKYDLDSTFLRYPVTRDRGKDKKKDSFKQFNNIKKLKKSKNDQGDIVMVVKDKNDNFVEGFQMVDKVLTDLDRSLKEIAVFLNGYHFMTRIELLKGW